MQNYCRACSQLEAARASAADRSVAAAVKILLTSKYDTELHSNYRILKIPHPSAFYSSPALFRHFVVRATPSQVPPEAAFAPRASPHPAQGGKLPQLLSEIQNRPPPLVDRALPNRVLPANLATAHVLAAKHAKICLPTLPGVSRDLGSTAPAPSPAAPHLRAPSPAPNTSTLNSLHHRLRKTNPNALSKGTPGQPC